MPTQKILIKGDFTVDGIPALENVSQPLQFLELDIQYDPLVTVEQVSSKKCD